jgi:hypothetical protein
MSDHTDPGHVTGSHERTSRSSTRVGDSGAPVGSPLTIVLAVIAVAVGFLIFRSISDDGDALGGAVLPDGATTLPTGVTIAGQTTTPGDTAATGPTTPTTAAARVTEGGTVVVVNAGEEGGSAAAMSTELADLGYTMVEGGVSDNDNVVDEALEETVVYFAGPGGPEAVARSVARDLGNVTVSQSPSDITSQISEEDQSKAGGASVYVMLGIDLSGQALPLPQAPAAPTNPTTTTG